MCAEAKPAMLVAELALAADRFRCAFCNPAFTCTAAVIGTKTLGLRGGGVARHGAQLSTPPTQLKFYKKG